MHRRIRFPILVALMLLTASSALAGTRLALPELRIPDVCGVNIHFTDRSRSAPVSTAWASTSRPVRFVRMSRMRSGSTTVRRIRAMMRNRSV